MSNTLVRFLLIVFFLPSNQWAPAQDHCKSQRVSYEPFDRAYENRMTVEPSFSRSETAGLKQWSPQRTAWVDVKTPDFQKPGPWTTVVSIRSTDMNLAENLNFTDHGSGGVSVRWLNEKLIYGSVWWGRIVSTDFIYDVEQRKFVYREMADYGQLTGPCE